MSVRKPKQKGWGRKREETKGKWLGRAERFSHVGILNIPIIRFNANTPSEIPMICIRAEKPPMFDETQFPGAILVGTSTPVGDHGTPVIMTTTLNGWVRFVAVTPALTLSQIQQRVIRFEEIVQDERVADYIRGFFADQSKKYKVIFNEMLVYFNIPMNTDTFEDEGANQRTKGCCEYRRRGRTE